MTTMVTETVRVTIDAALETVAADLSDPMTHPEWGTEFFSTPATRVADNEITVTVPRMGGEVTMKVVADPNAGIVDLYLAPVGAPFGPPIPVRVVPNADGADVLFTLARFPGLTDEQWAEGVASMQRELGNLKSRLEGMNERG
jgi:hypothetical protein